MSTREAGDVSSRPSLVSEEAFVLPAYPAGKILIEVIPNLTECRGIETPIVDIPASQNGIEELAQIVDFEELYVHCNVRTDCDDFDIL